LHLNGIQAAVVDMARRLSWIKSGGKVIEDVEMMFVWSSLIEWKCLLLSATFPIVQCRHSLAAAGAAPPAMGLMTKH
jgi:hypothetical protein